MQRKWLTFIAIILALLSMIVFYLSQKNNPITEIKDSEKIMLDKCFDNYSKDAIFFGNKYNVNPAYLLALIVLESSGKKIVPNRFEPKIYQKLSDVKNNKLSGFEGIDKNQLRFIKKEDLKKMASSWGPFQIMGYKCFQLNINLFQLIGDNIFERSIQWINLDYGNLVRDKNYKDAFHIHNTGQRYPRFGKPFTHNKDYVPRGLRYVEYFKIKLNNDNN